MSTATRGTVLAGRYRLEDRYHANTDSSVWRAADLTLDRAVTVRVVRPGHPHAADVADAARRAALIDDPRLVRVLDVGTDGDITFVVTSHVDGDTLATLIERAPLAPPVVRRIVGEVAQGLRGAAARGLHHLRLTPRSVIISYDNTIKLSGVAVEAAAAGLDPTSAADASRVDAVGLIALLYAGLTGRWPLKDTGFAPAPRANDGGPIAPTELVPDIPGDLNRLCLLTLGSLDSGPHTPAEVVGTLSPWPSAEEAPLRSATRPRDPATPATPNPALVMRARSSRPPTPAAGFRPGGPITSGPTGAPTSPPPAAASAWPPAGADNLFDPRRRDREAGVPDPDATLPPSAISHLIAPGDDEHPRARGLSSWASGNRPGTARPPVSPDDVTRRVPPPADRPQPAKPAAAENIQRRTASIFPTPSVAITGSMPLPPRAKGSSRTDAMFGGAPAEPEAEPSPPDNKPDRRQAAPPLSSRPAQGQAQSPAQSPTGYPTTRPAQGPQRPAVFSSPESSAAQPGRSTPSARPGIAPAAFSQPATAPAPNPDDATHDEHGRPIRRTASIFPTPSVAMTGSFPLPPRLRHGGYDRTDAMFGVEAAANTDLTPAPMREARRNEPAGPADNDPARPAQFAQPPRSEGTPDSGPIPTAAAARTAAGLRAGRPTSRPITAPAAGNPPSLFSSPNPPAGDAPGAGVAPGDTSGQHSGMGAERAAGPGRHRGPADGRAPAAANSRLPWEDRWSDQPPSPLESSGPFPIVIPPDAPPKDQSRKILVGIAVAFLVLLVLAGWQLRGMFSGSDDAVAVRESGPVITTAPTAAETEPDSATQPTASSSPTSTATEKAAEVEIKTSTAIDPEGDGDEDSARAPLAVDGKSSTQWESDRYESASFGGLKKGLGLAIELRRSAAVSSAVIDVAGTGGRVQVRTADSPEYDSSTRIGSGSFEDGTVTVDAKDDVGPAKYVILWFTELPSVEGDFRLEVSEVRLT